MVTKRKAAQDAHETASKADEAVSNAEADQLADLQNTQHHLKAAPTAAATTTATATIGSRQRHMQGVFTRTTRHHANLNHHHVGQSI